MIFIDHRERKYSDPNYSIPSMLEKLGIEIQKKHLEVGDYIIPGESMTACIELKSATDYVNSIINGRLNDELLNISANFEYPILLVYGSVTDAIINTEVRRSLWFNFLSACVTDISPVGKSARISVIHVESDFDAVSFMKTLHKKITSGNIFREPSVRKIKIPRGKEQLYSVMWMFPPDCHIGKTRAKSILDHYGSIHWLVNTDKEELESIDNIGPTIAERMINHIHKGGERKIDIEEREKEEGH